MNVYEGTFQCRDEDIEATKAQFIERFGPDIYIQYIQPYVNAPHQTGVGFLWFAPRSQYTYWFLHNVCKNMSERTGNKYEVPAELAIPDFTNPVEVFTCETCGILVEVPFFRDHEMRKVCMICNLKSILKNS